MGILEKTIYKEFYVKNEYIHLETNLECDVKAYLSWDRKVLKTILN